MDTIIQIFLWCVLGDVNFHNRSSFKINDQLNRLIFNYCKMRLLQWHIVTGMTGSKRQLPRRLKKGLV